MATPNMTRPRQNFHAESEAAINRQINMELYASHVYLSMASYFERDDLALPGFAKFFHKNSDEEREHAKKFIEYQNKRGGRCKYAAIEKPEKDEWGSGLDAMKYALKMEKDVNQSLLDMHGLATKHNDPTLTDFLEGEFLNEQVEAIKELSDYCTQLERVGLGLGEYIFDRETLHGEKDEEDKKKK